MIKHFIDCETSSLNPYSKRYPGEILSLAIITEYGDIRGIQENYWLISPQLIESADPKSLEVNGYTEEGWGESIPFSSIAARVSQLLYTGLIIGHNVSFDAKFLNHALRGCGYRGISYHHFDTRMLIYEHLEEAPKTSMKWCRDFFDMDTEGAHNALKDARDCLYLYNLLARSSAVKRAIWKRKLHR